MKTSHAFLASLFLFTFIMAMPPLGIAQVLPSEPESDRLVDEEVNVVVGLYTREYSLAGNGIVDFKTARQIIQAGQNAYGNTIVETLPFPLFYWYDENATGEFHMWIDRKGEGCRCDIVPYIALAGE